MSPHAVRILSAAQPRPALRQIDRAMKINALSTITDDVQLGGSGQR
ncbi:MAG: hypothetical protein ABIQ22_17385 [Arthrobacter oryzae]